MESKNEVWKTYPEFEWVQVSNLGGVKALGHYITRKDGRKQFVKGYIFKQYRNRNGYMYVHFKVNQKTIHLYVHRVVATCFLPNPDNLPQVNHKNCIRDDNCVDNLEWCTQGYNNVYREKYGIALCRPLFAVVLKTEKVLWFESQMEASRTTGVSSVSINNVIKNRRQQVGGYWFTENKSNITKGKLAEIKGDMRDKGVIAVNLKTYEALCFESQSNAGRKTGVDQSSVNRVTRGKQNQAGGFWFCHADKNAVEATRNKFGDATADKVAKLMEMI